VNTELANRLSAVPEKIPEGGTGYIYVFIILDDICMYVCMCKHKEIRNG